MIIHLLITTMRKNAKFVAILLIVAGFFSCDVQFFEDSEKSVRDKFLVDKIYDYQGNLLVEYLYDHNNRLTKRIYTNKTIHPVRTDEVRSEDVFEYKNGHVSKINSNTQSHTVFHEYGFETRDNYHSETVFEYDSRGRLIKENGRDLYFHYENGRIVSIGANVEPYINTIVYDNSGNIIEHIYICPELNMFGQPIAGTTQKVIYSYEYDDKPKPNFGLDDLFTFQPLPGVGTETGYARELSHNNLTKYINSGTTWSYTYNEYGLPKTIETKDIETLEPILMRITYKQIK